MHWEFCENYVLNKFSKFNLGLWACNSFRKTLRICSIIGSVVVAKVSINSHNLIVHGIIMNMLHAVYSVLFVKEKNVCQFILMQVLDD